MLAIDGLLSGHIPAGALFIREPGTARAQAFLTANASQVLVISPWKITEFPSALALKQRVGTISGQERQAALTMFEKFRGQREQIVALGKSPALPSAAPSSAIGGR